MANLAPFHRAAVVTALAVALYASAYAFDVAHWAIRDLARHEALVACHTAAHAPLIDDQALMLTECDALYR